MVRADLGDDTQKRPGTHLGLDVLVKPSRGRVVEREVGEGRRGERRDDEGEVEGEHLGSERGWAAS